LVRFQEISRGYCLGCIVENKDIIFIILRIAYKYAIFNLAHRSVGTKFDNYAFINTVKSLKIPKGYSESVNRWRTDNTIAKIIFSYTASSMITSTYVITYIFSGVRVTRSLVLCVCFVDRCFSFGTLFFWLLCCLFFIDLRILNTPLLSSSSSLYY
jgi:hypothetical protein